LITRTDVAEEPPAPPDRSAVSPPAPEAVTPSEGATPIGEGSTLSPAEISPNPYQPRASFAADELEGLQSSIAEHGILQPLVVRRTEIGYELIAGERRLRAARELGLAEVPVVLRQATNEEMQTLALVENLQRVDLNAMEKARALKAMMRNFELTQDQVATRVGKARTTIANMVRLLDLPDGVQRMVAEGRLSGAQGRALLQAEGAERRIRLAELAHKRGWSVREIEKRARQGPTIGKRRVPEPDPYVRDLEERMTRSLSTRVQLKMKGKGQSGAIQIAFANADELDRLLDLLG